MTVEEMTVENGTRVVDPMWTLMPTTTTSSNSSQAMMERRVVLQSFLGSRDDDERPLAHAAALVVSLACCSKLANRVCAMVPSRERDPNHVSTASPSLY